MVENVNLEVSSENISFMIKKLGEEGNVELLLRLYNKPNVNPFIRDELELALFNSVNSCVKIKDFEKLKMLIDNSAINATLRLHAKMGYEKKKLFFKNTEVLEVPKCLNCKNCTCGKNKEKLKNPRN